VVAGTLQIQVKPEMSGKKLNINLRNKIVNSKSNRPNVVERIERSFRPSYLD
jgi:hypothetical protein